MVDKRIIKRIESISSKIEFDEFVERVKLSAAPFEKREEIIELAKKIKPMYVAESLRREDEVKMMIEEGKADISDMFH